MLSLPSIWAAPCSRAAKSILIAEVSAHNTAYVGLASARSICDSIDLDTPERVESCTSVRPNAFRLWWRIGPISGADLTCIAA